MVTLTVTAARDEALTIIKAAIDGSVTFALEEVVYTDVEADVPKDASTWMRISMRHSGGEQVSLAGEAGTRRFERRGVLNCEGYFRGGNGQVLADEWLQLMLDSLEGKRSPGGIIFRNVTPRDDGQDGAWLRATVIADFEYDQIK